MRGVKLQFCILGVDDAPFNKDDVECALVCTVFRGGGFLDGVMSCIVEKDGLDATGKLSNLVAKNSHHDQLQAIMLDGITFGGLNVVNLKELSSVTGLPAIAIMRKKPDIESFENAIKKLPCPKERLRAVRAAGRIMQCGHVFFQVAGVSPEMAREIIRISTTRAKIPEPIRAAHIIARGIAGILRTSR